MNTSKNPRKNLRRNLSVFLLAQIIFFSAQSLSVAYAQGQEDEMFKQYVSFFEEVFKTIDENYYYPVSIDEFKKFVAWFKENIYSKLRSPKRMSRFTKWRSAAYMVDYLKAKEDRFSAFFPPKYAKKYEEKVLGKKIDIGITGKLTDKGYLVSRVEPRSDSFAKGLREQDLITKINGMDVLAMNEESIDALLTPLIDTTIRLSFVDHKTKKKRNIKIISKEYFKQSVFPIPVDVPGVHCLEIKTFNRKTSEDMFRFLTEIEKEGKTGLILDLRGNPGGPPLAAREISAFFLSPKEEFAYFQKKNHPKAILDVPKIPKKYHYSGPMIILVNKESGSASELFSGVLQKQQRAILMGTNTAGQVFLKSMFHFDDESMVLLVTARGHFPDGEVFDFKGLTPNKEIKDDKINLVRYAADYLKKNFLDKN